MEDSSVDVKVEADKLEQFLANIKTKMQKASTDIIEELADFALDKIQANYSRAEFQPGEAMDFLKTGSDTEKTVSMAGPQAWYSEFGTGTYGEMQPHPLKGKFALNPYNSGETIRTASAKVAEKAGAIQAGIAEGDLYWTYQANDGQIYYSKGIPAQKEVYDAGQELGKKIPEVSIKHVKEMFQ